MTLWKPCDLYAVEFLCFGLATCQKQVWSCRKLNELPPNTAPSSTSIILHYTVICRDSPYVEVHSAPYKRTHLEARLQLQTLARNVSRNVIPSYQRFGNTPVKITPSSALNWSWRSQDGAMPVKRSCFGAYVGYVLRLYATLQTCGPKRGKVKGGGEYDLTFRRLMLTIVDVPHR